MKLVLDEQGVKIWRGDCMEYMAGLPDKAYSLGVVDPNYGIGWDKERESMSAGLRRDGSQRKMKTWNNPTPKMYAVKTWDKEPPPPIYFDELARTCSFSMVWGGNYFSKWLPPSGGWVVWDKGVPDGMSLSQAELAWNNITNNVKICRVLWAGYKKNEPDNRFHPTQKPVALYRWLLANYANPGDTILDTHLGSGSSAIAAWELGFSFTGIELDGDYVAAAVERIRKRMLQPKLPIEIPVKATQGNLL